MTKEALYGLELNGRTGGAHKHLTLEGVHGS